MKKSIALVALAFGVTNAFAQDLTSKKGEPILPEAGDWGIAVDATPFLNYAGNMFGKTANNVAPTWNFLTNNQTITGKYFKDAGMAYRGTLRIGFGGATVREMAADRMTTANSPTANGFPTASKMVENTWKHSNTTIGLAGGIEKRKGKTRLQGFYGGEVGIYANMQKDKYTYGNTLAVNLTPTGPGQATNVDVTAADNVGASGNVVSAVGIFQGAAAGDQARITERKYGTVFSFGVRGFIGAEYFFLPKMSFGGEFGWGLGISSTGKSKTTYEATGNNGGSATDAIGSAEIEGSKNGSFALDTDNKNSVWGPSATLRLAFHF
ncbi:MAG: hypothetical protein H0U95_10205 [Bacteroidetes bacterium]|nr:hypothetical protein [Bacteroidota bacterium]